MSWSVCLLLSGGETTLRAFCLSALWQIYETMYLLFRVQECRPLTPQDAGIIVLSMGDRLLTHLPQVSRPNKSPLWDKYPTSFGEGGNDSSSSFVLTTEGQGIEDRVLVPGVDPRSLCIDRGEYSLTKSCSLIRWTYWDMNLERGFII
jgi:hypothetical protein